MANTECRPTENESHALFIGTSAHISGDIEGLHRYHQHQPGGGRHSLRRRELISFCFIPARGGCDHLRGHTVGNLMVGSDKEKLYGVAEQCLSYIGYHCTLNVMNITDEAAEQLAGQSTE